jgi:metallophosphoesterase (TIGR03768 family)
MEAPAITPGEHYQYQITIFPGMLFVAVCSCTSVGKRIQAIVLKMKAIAYEKRERFMKKYYEYKKSWLVLLTGALIFFLSGCTGSDGSQVAGYPIDSDVQKTDQRMLAFPFTMSTPPPVERLSQVSQYDALGYGTWTFGARLPAEARTDSTTFGIMPAGYVIPALPAKAKLLNFFALTDIHITDKESPNQLIYLQQLNSRYAGANTSIYSPIMMYTTHVLDAAIQTANALHRTNAFDFGISLGDFVNSAQYNELRWYIDVIDGKVIIPSSGDHRGAGTIDYQKPYKAAGLDKSIPWYQTLGNHDHFFIGSFPVDADPSLGLRASYISGTVWAIADILTPNFAAFPVLFNMENMKATPKYYQGVLDGSTPLGAIVKAGKVGDPGFVSPPAVAADPDRRSLLRTELIGEFFKTTSNPVGHGFNLVNPTQQSGFACYSFLPKSNIPIKVIVLDDTQSETDGSTDIHGHGYLDANRWAWLQAELVAGQAANQLMIIAAHIPIAVVKIGDETEWWLGDRTARPTGSWWTDSISTTDNAVTLEELIATLQNTPNLLMWIAGHRHLNTVKAFVSPDPTRPEKGFWQVETSSLRDFPQQFRTFEIYLNSDYTISIVTINVDPAVKAGTPAAISRKYAIAAQQIVQNNLTVNNPNQSIQPGLLYPLPSMDPTRPQGTPVPGTPFTDPTIRYVDLSGAAVDRVPYNASYNAILYKQLSPAMKAYMQTLFP